MKLIPIINLEDKILGIPKPDIAGLLMVLLVVGFFRAIVSFSSYVDFAIIGLFILYTLFKRSLEKKEQSLFVVLWSNSRIPDCVAGVFRLKRFLGVHKDVK